MIPCAGTGRRVANEIGSINKALFTLGNLPVIAHVIEMFPENVPTVIILGYQAEMVEDSLRLLFPERQIEFVYVEIFEGPGSGLGKSLLTAKPKLNCPFVFSPNDCFPLETDFIYDLDPSVSGNWVAGATVENLPEAAIAQYRHLNVENDHLDVLWPKGKSADAIYTGFCGILDWNEFWKGLESEQDVNVGESAGIRALSSVRVFRTNKWIDVGNIEMLNSAKRQFHTSDFNVLPKQDEAIWFRNKSVVKFFSDPNKIERRVQRLDFLPSRFVPENVVRNRYCYRYDFINGDVLSKSKNVGDYIHVLDEMNQNAWNKNRKSSAGSTDLLIKFYRDKTFDRVNQFLISREFVDREECINGLKVPPVLERLKNIDWEKVTEQSLLAGYHGDFHKENIIFDSDSKSFKLIDWREDFGGEFCIGDVYYDLAKFLHGLIVSHSFVHEEKYLAIRLQNEYVIDIHRSFLFTEVESEFFHWLRANGYSEEKVKLITALIFLNIAALHHDGYDLFLMLLGRYLLEKYSGDYFCD